MEAGSGSPLTARAKFPFEGTNNDELSFDKDDMITITQQHEEGWWEGTREGVTGWFPSGYVTLITEKDKLQRSRSVPNANAVAREVVDLGAQPDYRAEVLSSFVAAEEEYIKNLAKTLQTLLIPLGTARVLSTQDYCTLVGNFEDIYTLQKKLLDSLEIEQNQDLPKMRIGGIFMSAALEIRTALSAYSANHPDAVEVLKKEQKAIEKKVQEEKREYKDLVSGLSEPLRHIERYYSLLQELERIVAPNHPDRGDLQRGAAVFRETKDLCETLRKQKETQLDFLDAAKIDQVVASPQRGAILYVGIANVQHKKVEPIDRFIALFTKYIMFFEATENMTYDIKEKFPIGGFIVRKKDATGVVLDHPKTGEITITFFTSGGDIDRFMEAVGKAENVTILAAPTSNILRRPSKNAMDHMNQSQIQSPENPLTNKPPHPPNAGNIDFGILMGKRKSSKNYDDPMNSSGLKFDHELGMVLPEGFELPTSSRNSRNTSDNFQFSQFPAYFLSGNAGKRSERGFRLRKDAARDEEIEFESLKILDGYCVETGGGGVSDFHGANDSYQQPHLIVAEDEKILVEEMVGDEVVLQEKSIVDAVYSIKDQLSFLQTEFQKLAKVVEAEQKARRRLEHNLPKMSGIISPDGSSSTPRKEINSLDS